MLEQGPGPQLCNGRGAARGLGGPGERWTPLFGSGCADSPGVGGAARARGWGAGDAVGCRWGPRKLRSPLGLWPGPGRRCSPPSLVPRGVRSCGLCSCACPCPARDWSLGSPVGGVRSASPRNKVGPHRSGRGKHSLWALTEEDEDFLGEDGRASCIPSGRGTFAESCLLWHSAPNQEFSGIFTPHQESPIVCAKLFLILF